MTSVAFLAACGGGGGSAPPEPQASILFPSSNSTTDDATITVRGIISSPGRVASVTVSGSPAFSSDSWASFTADVPLDLERNALAVELFNAAGDQIAGGVELEVWRTDFWHGEIRGVVNSGSELIYIDADRGSLIAKGPQGTRETPIVSGALEFSDDIKNPGIPTIMRGFGTVFVPDSNRIHRVNEQTGVRRQLYEGPIGSWIYDIEYNPMTDQLVVLENSGFLGGFARQIKRVDTLTGADELCAHWVPAQDQSAAPTGLMIDLAVTRLTCFLDGGPNCVVASDRGMMLCNLDSGNRAPISMEGFVGGEIRDVMCREFKAYVMGPESVVEWSPLTGLFVHQRSLSGADFVRGAGEWDPANSILRLVDSSGIAYDYDLLSDELSPSIGEGVGVGAVAGDLRDATVFAGQRLMIDASRDRVLSFGRDGERAIFCAGGWLVNPVAMTVRDGALLVGCSDGKIVQVDSEGQQVLARGATPQVAGLRDLDLANDGETLIALCANRIVRLLPQGGVEQVSGPQAGDGDPLIDARKLVLLPGLEAAYVACGGSSGADAGKVMGVFLDGGLRFPVADENTGAGAAISRPAAIALDAESSTLFIAAGPEGAGRMSIYRLHLPSLQRTLVSGVSIGGGPLVDVPSALILDEATGNLLVAGRAEGAILEVDKVTGDRVVITR